MDEPTGSCSPLYASLFDDPPSPSICIKSARIRLDASFSLPYEIAFSMSFMSSLHGGMEADSDRKLYYKWYKIKIFAEGPVGSEVPELFPFWEGRLPHMSSFAALGTNIYTFGGQVHSSSSDHLTFSPNLNVLDVYRWPIVDVLPAAPMIFPRLDPQSLVLDGKLFIIGGNILIESTTCWDICWENEEGEYEEGEYEEEDYEEEESEEEESEKGESKEGESKEGEYEEYEEEEEECSFVQLYHSRRHPPIEVYDPITGRWDTLARAPFPIESHYICAALENPNRILIASLTERGEPFLDGKARFFQYDLSHRYWKILFERYIHPKCPLGYDGGKALAVGNKLYWITDDAMLLVYCLDDDKWLLGNLKGRGISFLDKCKEPSPPVLLHLENKRFSMTQFGFGYVHCVIIDVVPLNDSLAIFVVCTHKYKVESPSVIQNSFLL
jgi:hypothetical protein